MDCKTKDNSLSGISGIRILDILEETMADGPGLRTAIYCAGCAHHCSGCHNPQSWDFMGGRMVRIEEILDIIKEDEFSNVTFSGGDPLYQVEGFTELARRIKEETDKTIWCYTGFTYEEIIADARLSMILPFGCNCGRAVHRGEKRQGAAFQGQLQSKDNISEREA